MPRTLVVAALLLTACSQGATPPAAGTRELPLLRPPLTTPDPHGLVGATSLPWDAVAYVDYRTVDVHYVASGAGCSRLADVRVTETRDTVTITLVDGTPPDRLAEPCLAIGLSARTRVRLPRALDGRRLVDGATGEVHPLRAY